MQRDVVILGGGPGGATLAMHLLAEGVKPLIVEKETFPRYHIGESMTGEAVNVLRSLGLGPIIEANGHPTRKGALVLSSKGKNSWWVPVMLRDANHELVEGEAWQVRRSVFDQTLLDEAVRRGAELVKARAVEVVRGPDPDEVRGVVIEHPSGEREVVHSRMLCDVTGQATWLAHQGVTSPKEPGRYDKQIAVFSQIRNPVRGEGFDGVDRPTHPDNTIIFYAELYHWAWFIPLDDEIVSVGVVVPSSYFASKGETKEAFLRRELKELHPELARRVVDTELAEEARAIPNYSYFIERFAGKGWLCVGDTHRFIDPIFSFGLYLTMKEGQHAAPLIRRYLAGELGDGREAFATHTRRMETAIDHYQDLIDGFWGEAQGFAYLVNNPRTRNQVIDMFAGRIYDVTERDIPAIKEMRALARKAREGGRLYGEDRRRSGFVAPTA
ncbi:MAG: tryptophan 7-halogenase [Gemmatimonadetes bacterium]|nr:tryptophan 7-halogenase [Gemmatimonadota bacterium]